MKILIVGDGNHPLITNLCKHLKNFEETIDIDLLSYTIVSDDNKSIYNNIVAVLPKFKHKKIGGKIINNAYWMFKCLTLGKYDVINIHFVTYLSLPLLLKRKKTHIISTVWGTDFYKSTSNKIFTLILKKSHLITTSTHATLNNIKSALSVDNITVANFGLEPITHIKQLLEENMKQEIKSQLGVKEGELTISVGYNASHKHRHLEIVNIIENINLNIPYKYFVPLMYGDSKAYIDELKANLAPFNSKIIYFDRYMDGNEIAKLRVATDIFINLRDTDQLSGAICEHLCARNIVITGNWLPYDDLDNRKVFYYKLEGFNQLGGVLKSIVNSNNEINSNLKLNSSKIEDFTLWERNIKTWFKLYENKSN